MAAGPAYTPIATTTLGSSQSSVTFNSLSGYTDLVLVAQTGAATGDYQLLMRFNSDTGTNYNWSQYWGPSGGTSQSSENATNQTYLDLQSASSTIGHIVIAHIMNYSNTTTNKPVISRAFDANNNRTYTSAMLWRSTSAITSILVYPSAGNLATGSVLTIYGIKAA